MPQRRFTLRLTEEEFRELSRIKGLIGTTTTNKAVRYIINHFVELNNRYIEEINKNTALKEKYKKQDRCIESLVKSISSLKELEELEIMLPEKGLGRILYMCSPMINILLAFRVERIVQLLSCISLNMESLLIE